MTWGVAGSARRRRGSYALLAIPLVILIAAGAVAALALTSTVKVSTGSAALARLEMPFGGAQVQRLSVLAGRDQRLLSTRLSENSLWPNKRLSPGERVTVDVVVKRPGWLSWLTGSTQQVRYTFLTPSSSPRSQYVTVRSGHDLKVNFSAPVRVVAYGASAASLSRHVLASSRSSFSLKPASSAGTMAIAGAPRTWESPKATYISWFPPGRKATVVARPAPGSQIKPTTKITLTFSKPVSQALGSHLPPVSPNTQGTWHRLNSHTIQFVPTGYGYGLGATVKIGLPASVHVNGAGGAATWSVPAGSTTRLQQLLAMTGYLPFNFSGSNVPMTPGAQEQAAIAPPKGSFTLRWQNIPGWYKGMWAPGSYGELTKAAVMAFENSHGMTADGVDGPQVWNALISDVIQGKRNSFGYTVVDVSEGSPEGESTWHNGKTVASGPVNTGVASMPTATGTFAVFEHVPVTTMSGTNPDGSHYVDPGIQWVSYFNGGDALHEFPRAGYGYPQSDGCVEMPDSEAAAVYPFTPIGTIVHVT